MHECEFSCGRYISENEKYCKFCLQDLENDFSKWLHEKFVSEEIEALNIIFDGRELA